MKKALSAQSFLQSVICEINSKQPTSRKKSTEMFDFPNAIVDETESEMNSESSNPSSDGSLEAIGKIQFNISPADAPPLDSDFEQNNEESAKDDQCRKKSYGKSRPTKIDCCYYCKGSFKSQISKHYLSVHKKESDVQHILQLQTGTKERKQALRILQNKGNFKHNSEVLKVGEGELITVKQCQGSKTKDYVPCTKCFAFVKTKQISKHQKHCPATSNVEERNALRLGRTMLASLMPLISEENPEVIEIFERMKETSKYPDIKSVCRKDALIVAYCQSLLGRLGESNEQRRKDKDNIRTKLRHLARLLLKLNKEEVETNDLSYYITAAQFDKVLSMVKKISLEATSPSLAILLGNHLKHICILKKSIGIRLGNDIIQKEANDFDSLFKAHWNHSVSSVANRRIKLSTMNKPNVTPSTDDLICLKDFLIGRIKEMTTSELNFEDWTFLAKLLLVRIILFNKRRVSEVEELKIGDYVTRVVHNTNNSEIIQSLSVTERLLAHRMDLIEVRGKSTRGLRKVFILLTEDMQDGLKHLLTNRSRAGISDKNPFMFARKTLSPLDGCQAMRDIPRLCGGVKRPDLIRTRLLRKYLATTTQILDMSGDELKMVADHMGHSLNIHSDIYRLQSSILEKTKVARVLLAVENGHLSKFSGKDMRSIEITDVPEPTDEDEKTDSEEEALEEELEEEQIQIVIEQTTQLKTVSHARKRWTREEEDILQKAFGSCFTEKRNVSLREIQEAKLVHPILSNRADAVIRSKINNILLGKVKL